MTAQLECLLDDVVVGKQEMVGAIDAVCEVAQRIIDKLTDGAAAGGAPLLGAAVGNGAAAYPPTPAMKRFADSLVRQERLSPVSALGIGAVLIGLLSVTTRPGRRQSSVPTTRECAH